MAPSATDTLPCPENGVSFQPLREAPSNMGFHASSAAVAAVSTQSAAIRRALLCSIGRALDSTERDTGLAARRVWSMAYLFYYPAIRIAQEPMVCSKDPR